MTRWSSAKILKMLRAVDWPRSPREYVPGYRTCVGATYDGESAKLGKHTMRQCRLIRAVNHELRVLLGPKFRWGSLQINYNTIPKPHIDKNNTGLSALIWYVSFTGGAFHNYE